jgi:hypothetical protein
MQPFNFRDASFFVVPKSFATELSSNGTHMLSAAFSFPLLIYRKGIQQPRRMNHLTRTPAD